MGRLGALLRKKGIVMWYNKRAFFCGFIMPLIFGLLVGILTTVLTPGEATPQVADTTYFAKGSFVPVVEPSGGPNVIPMLSSLSPGLQYKDFASNDAIDDYMAKPQHRDTSPIGFAFGGSSSVVTFLYNKTNTGLNVPAGLNFVTNALVSSISELGPSYTIPATSLILPEGNDADFIFLAFGPVLLSYGLLFMSGTIVLLIVTEKEKELKLQLQLSSLPLKWYWLGEFLTDFALCFLASMLLVILGVSFSMPPFNSNVNPLAYMLLYILLSANLPLFVYILSFVFDKAETAQRFFITLLNILTVVPYYVILYAFGNGKGSTPLGPSLGFCVIPTYALSYYLQTLSQYSAFGTKVTAEKIFSTPELGGVLLILFLEIILLATIIACIEYFRFWRLRRGAQKARLIPGTPAEKEDDDVQVERDRVLRGEGGNDDVFQLVNIYKVFEGSKRKNIPDKKVVDNVCFGIQRGECFGLLGPNGAGKTTLINVLTGIYGPTGGRAYVQGKSIFSYETSVLSGIGVCPQFDRLWDELSPRQHLHLYGSIRGLTGRDLKLAVQDAIDKFDLREHADKRSKQLSGGNKRKLSVSMAFIGNPKVVMLDEPSSGMDPVTRRKLWDMILEKKGKQECGVILTTHFMEEADALCSRIGIMINGVLRCVGRPQHLKNKYGGGYRLHMRASSASLESVDEWIQEMCPGCKSRHKVGETLSYELPPAGHSLASLFRMLQENKLEKGILDYSLCQTTLEQVFLNFARQQKDS